MKTKWMGQYGCVKCQKYHNENDRLYQKHILFQSKHGIQMAECWIFEIGDYVRLGNDKPFQITHESGVITANSAPYRPCTKDEIEELKEKEVK